MLVKRLLSQHVSQLRTATKPRPLIVDRIESIKVFGRHFYSFDDIASKHTRAIDSIVEPLELGKGFIVERVDKCLIGDVASSLEDLSGRIDAQNSVFGLLERLRVDVGDGDS